MGMHILKKTTSCTKINLSFYSIFHKHFVSSPLSLTLGKNYTPPLLSWLCSRFLVSPDNLTKQVAKWPFLLSSAPVNSLHLSSRPHSPEPWEDNFSSLCFHFQQLCPSHISSSCCLSFHFLYKVESAAYARSHCSLPLSGNCGFWSCDSL